MLSDDLTEQAAELIAGCRAAGLTLVTAESCTGGLIAACLTDIAGASDVFDSAYVTYSNTAKTRMLGVPAEVIGAHGAVSREVALAMAAGALARAGAGIAVAVTGIAGPGGGTAEKPVGLVHIAACTSGRQEHRKCTFGDKSRRDIRLLTVKEAIALSKYILNI